MTAIIVIRILFPVCHAVRGQSLQKFRFLLKFGGYPQRSYGLVVLLPTEVEKENCKGKARKQNFKNQILFNNLIAFLNSMTTEYTVIHSIFIINVKGTRLFYDTVRQTGKRIMRTGGFCLVEATSVPVCKSIFTHNVLTTNRLVTSLRNTIAYITAYMIYCKEWIELHTLISSLFTLTDFEIWVSTLVQFVLRRWTNLLSDCPNRYVGSAFVYYKLIIQNIDYRRLLITIIMMNRY